LRDRNNDSDNLLAKPWNFDRWGEEDSGERLFKD